MTDRSALGARAIRAIDDRQAQLFALSQAIHADPEPGYQEHRASARLAALLTECGFAVTRGYGGVETAYRADAAGWGRGPRPRRDGLLAHLSEPLPISAAELGRKLGLGFAEALARLTALELEGSVSRRGDGYIRLMKRE